MTKRYFIILIFSLCGCQTTVTPQEFVNYVNDKDNGFIKHKKIKNYSFTLQFLPADYIALQYVFSGLENDFDKLKSESDSSLHFKLTICDTDSVPQDKKSRIYEQKIQYLNSSFIENCFLVTNSNDTLRPVIHHYEKGFNLKPCENVLFAFENTKTLNPRILIIKAPPYTVKNIVFDLDKIKNLKVPLIKI